MTRRVLTARSAWIAWTLLVIAITTFPWSNVVGHPHWDRVAWSPARDGYANLPDTVLNVMLFLPYGWLGVRALAGARRRDRPEVGQSLPAGDRPGPRSTALTAVFVVALGVTLSIAAEAVQLYSHDRYSSMTDVIANACGAVLGAVLGRREIGG